MLRQIVGRMKTASKTLIRSKYDALDLLRADHMRLEFMMILLRVIRDQKGRIKLLQEIRKDVEKHMRLESDLFYPACEKIPGLRKLITQSHRDHQLVKSALNELGDMKPSSKRFNSVVGKTLLAIERHVITEENEIFEAVIKGMKPADFRRLNSQMVAEHAKKPEKSAARPARKAA